MTPPPHRVPRRGVMSSAVMRSVLMRIHSPDERDDRERHRTIACPVLRRIALKYSRLLSQICRACSFPSYLPTNTPQVVPRYQHARQDSRRHLASSLQPSPGFVASGVASPNEASMAVSCGDTVTRRFLSRPRLTIGRGQQEGPGVNDLPEYDPKASSTGA